MHYNKVWWFLQGKTISAPQQKCSAKGPKTLLRYENFRWRETNRAEQKNQQGLIPVSGLSDKIPPGEFMESSWQSLGIPSGIPVRVTELLASECNRAAGLWIDH